MLVRIIKDWDYPDIMRQTPGSKGIWDGITFTTEEVDACDYVIILNRVPKETTVKCPVQNVWTIIQEPPVWQYRWLRKGFVSSDRVFMQEKLPGNSKKCILSHGALPWHIGKTYDFLKECTPAEKKDDISWVTSSTTELSGHRKRMSFLKLLKENISFNLYGKGFEQIEDKWNALAPYRYSLAVENTKSEYYWTEKISDCFLSWTMPIYYGCSKIGDYFPKESYLEIDIEKPKEAANIIKEAIEENKWKKNLDAIAHARELVLEKYQLFSFIGNLIENREEVTDKNRREVTEITLNCLPYLYPSPLICKYKKAKLDIKHLCKRSGRKIKKLFAYSR